MASSAAQQQHGLVASGGRVALLLLLLSLVGHDGSAFSAREVLSRALVDIDEANGVVRLSMVMGPVVMGPRGW
jgi:hypothetical protein